MAAGAYPRLMIVPVWAATWEIDCCQPEAEAGKEWRVPVVFRPGPDPWWVTACGATATEEQRRLGLVRLDAVSEQVDEDLGQQLMTAGSVSFRAEAGVGPGAIEGRLHLDAHLDSARFRGRDEVRGVVERVDLVPLRYVERAERHWVPAEQLDPIEATSTRAREDLARPDGGHVEVQLLVWLRVE